MNDLSDTFVRLGGGDEAVLERVPSARPAFIQIAIALLVTASMATASMWFALHDALDAHWLVATLIAPCWGLVILGMDRTLMLLGMGGGRGATIASVAGRFTAAVLIGIVVSTPLTLRMFASDIDAELAAMRATQSELNKAWIADSQEKQQVADLEQQVDDWENIAAGVLPASFADSDSSALADQVAQLKEQLPDLEHAADQAAILYNCDTYGGGREKLDHPEKCAAVPGTNGNSALYKAQADEAAQAVLDAQTKINALQKRLEDANRDRLGALQAQASGQLETLRPQLAEARRALTGFESGVENANTGNTGLLAQLTALWEAGEQSTLLMVTHLLIALLFIVIEVLPVMAKLLWRITPGGKDYEEVARSLDEYGVAGAQTRRAEAQIQAETAYEAALLAKDAELDRIQLVAEHEQELARLQQAAELDIERHRADAIAAMGIAVDAEFAARRQAELRRRAEAAFRSWASRPTPRAAADHLLLTGPTLGRARTGEGRGRRRWGWRRAVS
ncbi:MULTISPECIES: DUF4407 domain-containing protein [Aeromicrobium]|uniref:DUF4407 domain-containing protein n=1 Tax=Aeromicrobium TaxID=2040 RepID=UPI00257968D3|nr:MULTISPECIES: DUF4407 domain-containing protein [Aeromicrobium]